ncbi:MAG: RS21-C6 protein [Bacteroidia bacterium]|nr:RS21-C6 protein [Bacteroidia bacterium]
MAKLPKSPSLPELQAYQIEIAKERGWDDNKPLESFLLFSEEVGELAKAIRNRLKLFQEEGKSSPNGELEGEFADVLSYLIELANQFDINLEEVYKKKEEINASRNWN